MALPSLPRTLAMFKPKLITKPAHRLLTRDEAKAHLRVDEADDDSLIDALILAAENYLDGYNGELRRCIINQVWQEGFKHFQEHMRLTFPDVNDVDMIEIKYIDGDETEQTYDGAFELYEDAISSILRLKSIPAVSTNVTMPVTISYQVGLASEVADIPASIVVAVKMLVAHWYENREAAAPDRMENVPLGVEALLRRYRRYQ